MLSVDRQNVVMLRAIMLNVYLLSINMLSVVMLSATILNVFMPSVNMLNVIAPSKFVSQSIEFLVKLFFINIEKERKGETIIVAP